MLTEEQKKQLGELQLFKNKEDNVSIEVSLHFLNAIVVLLKTSLCNVLATLLTSVGGG